MKSILTILLTFVAFSLSAGAKTIAKQQEPQKPTESNQQKPDERFIPITDKTATIELKSSDTIIYRTVNVSLGEVLILQFPQGINVEGPTVMGNYSLFKVDANNIPVLSLQIWALVADEGLNSNFQFSTNIGITFIFNLKISSADKASNRITFTYPEFSAQQKTMQDSFILLKKKYDDEQAKAMADIDKIAERKRLEMLAQNFGGFYMCREYKVRSENSWVFLMSDRICALGAEPQTILLNFVVKNNSRNYFYIKEIKIYAVENGGKVPLDIVVAGGNGKTSSGKPADGYYWLEKFGIQYRETLNGGVTFITKEPAKSYYIELIEEGGKQRTLEVQVEW